MKVRVLPRGYIYTMGKLHKLRKDILAHPEKYKRVCGARVNKSGKIYISYWSNSHSKFIESVLKKMGS